MSGDATAGNTPGVTDVTVDVDDRDRLALDLLVLLYNTLLMSARCSSLVRL